MVDEAQYELGLKLAGIFMPDLVTRITEVRDSNRSFIHYTSVDAAIKIIKSEEVWLRNARVMNDFMEIQHGQNCLMSIWHDDDVGKKLKSILEELGQDTALEFAQLFDMDQFARTHQSYIFSMSEHNHDDPMEERYGRLSMWRAYGGSPNVALVLNKTPFFSKSSAIAASCIPVLYEDEDTFKNSFSKVVRNIEANLDFLKGFDPKGVIASLKFYFGLYALSLKHPSFLEEKEWRVISNPIFPFPDVAQTRLSADIVVLQGVAQRVLKIKMRDYETEGFIGAKLSSLLKEVVIGPSDSPLILKDALVQTLREMNVLEPENRVRFTNIPLRR